MSVQQTLVIMVFLFDFFSPQEVFCRTDKFITQFRNSIKKDLITDGETERRKSQQLFTGEKRYVFTISYLVCLYSLRYMYKLII